MQLLVLLHFVGAVVAESDVNAGFECVVYDRKVDAVEVTMFSGCGFDVRVVVIFVCRIE